MRINTAENYRGNPGRIPNVHRKSGPAFICGYTHVSGFFHERFLISQLRLGRLTPCSTNNNLTTIITSKRICLNIPRL